MPDPLLRRYEVQIAYPAAFLFWSFGGVLAESWAKGPHFSAYGYDPNQLTFTESPETSMLPSQRQSNKVAIAGIRTSAFFWRSPPSLTASRHLAIQFLGDVLKVLEPQVTQITVRIGYYEPIASPTTANQRFQRTFGLTQPIINRSGGIMVNGASFQHRSVSGADVTMEAALFGILNKDQFDSYFAGSQPEDPEWAYAIAWELWRRQPEGFDRPRDVLTRTLEDASRRSEDALTQTLGKLHAV